MNDLIMKKITLLSLISAISYGAVAHAGAMGESGSCCSAFVALEGGYTRSMIDNYDYSLIGLGSITSTKNNDGYTARLAAGMISMVDDQVGFTGELGWGYYGRTTLDSTNTGLLAALPSTLSIQHTLSGFDVLLGVAYVQQYFSLSLKAGALVQNMQTKTDANIIDLAFPIYDSFTEKKNQTAVLPEIKLGAAYNFDDNWAITGAYMYALGGTPRSVGTFNPDTGRANLVVNSQNPSTNTLLLGIQYTV